VESGDVLGWEFCGVCDEHVKSSVGNDVSVVWNESGVEGHGDDFDVDKVEPNL